MKQKLGDSEHWTFPLCNHRQGETLRETAERGLYDICGSDVSAKFLGNAPCGHLKYNYVDGDTEGSKVSYGSKRSCISFITQ